MRLDARLAHGDELGVPQGEPAQQQERARGEEGLRAHQRVPAEQAQVQRLAFLGLAEDLGPHNLEAEHHEEQAAQDREGHVQEEVAVVPVTDAIVQPVGAETTCEKNHPWMHGRLLRVALEFFNIRSSR